MRRTGLVVIDGVCINIYESSIKKTETGVKRDGVVTIL